MVKGFKNAGFIYLTNHGIPPSTLLSVFGHLAQFFTLPQEQKDKLAWYSPEANRGYTGHGREKTSMPEEADKVAELREAAPDLKESLEIGRDDEVEYPNMWPAEGVGEGEGWAGEFKEVMKGFFEQCKEFHMLVMRAIAVGLGIEEKWFDGFTDGGDNTLRLLHYPAVKKEVFDRNKNQVRAGAHTDYGKNGVGSSNDSSMFISNDTSLGSITLLFQDARGGLQVESPHGNFIDAKPVPDTIVINAGDLLARWSNDTIKSTKHQVVEPPIKEEYYPARYSIAYFCNPNFNKDIEAIPGTLVDGMSKYKKINSGDYLVQRLTETY
jgi:isopenicillin N synthase-like dioxygenase